MRSRMLFCILLALSFCSHTVAQEVKRPNLTGWLLEVRFLKGSPPAYERVRWPDSKTPGDWFGRFGRVAGWQLPLGAKPIQAVRILPYLQDEIVTIKVSVLRGEKFMDGEDMVATYDLRENETTTVEPLKDFGVEPFELRAFKSTPLLANQPAAINNTTSVEVIGIEAVTSDMPEYKLTLQNLSQKAIDALRVDIADGNGPVSSGMPQGLEGKHLMQGGETVQVRIPLKVHADRAGATYAPFVPLQQQIIIKSVVFADGTTDGVSERDFQSGPGFQSLRFGQMIELQRALPLFADALQSTATAAHGVSDFRSKLEGLNLEIADSDLVDLRQRFPTRDAKLVKPPVDLGIHFMWKEMLDQLTRFESMRDRKDFRSWLVDSRERYSQWLTRLEAANASQL